MTLSKTLCLKLLGRPKFDKLLYKKIDYVSRSKLSSCVTKENSNIILRVILFTVKLINRSLIYNKLTALELCVDTSPGAIRNFGHPGFNNVYPS